MKFAAYVGDEWKFDLNADSKETALQRAKEQNMEVTRVELVSETEGRGSAR